MLLWLATPGLAQRREDPLTQTEIDQLRDSAVEAEPRMKLYVEFARARLVKLEQMRSDPKVTDRPRQTHNMLEEFLTIYNELNDNLDNFEGRKADLRKALKHVIEGDTEFQAKLRGSKAIPAVRRKKPASTSLSCRMRWRRSIAPRRIIASSSPSSKKSGNTKRKANPKVSGERASWPAVLMPAETTSA